MKRDNKPRWWLLDILVLLTVALLLWQTRWTLSAEGWQLVVLGIVLLAYGLMALWVWGNREALERKERAREAVARARVVYSPSRTPVQAHFREVMRPHGSQREVGQL
ncbi:MAG: hypothetical protein ACRDIB_14005 [Ardenticatenaceae bacterium]